MTAERRQNLSLLIFGLVSALLIPWLIAYRDAPPGGGGGGGGAAALQAPAR